MFPGLLPSTVSNQGIWRLAIANITRVYLFRYNYGLGTFSIDPWLPAGYMTFAGENLMAVGISPNGRYLALGSGKSVTAAAVTISVYDLLGSNSTPVATYNHVLTNGFLSRLFWSPDGQKILVCATDKPSPFVLLKFNGTSLTHIASAVLGTTANNLGANRGCFSADSKRVLISPYEGNYKIFDISSGSAVEIGNGNFGTYAIDLVTLNNNYLLMGTDSAAPYLRLYSWSGGTLTPVSVPVFGTMTARANIGAGHERRFYLAGGTNKHVLDFDGAGNATLDNWTVAAGTGGNTAVTTPDGLFGINGRLISPWAHMYNLTTKAEITSPFPVALTDMTYQLSFGRYEAP